MKLIVAVNNHGYIGKNGELMWKCKADLKHFKQLTIDCGIIVGRTTYEKCLGGKKLPNRKHYIVTTDPLTHAIPDEDFVVGTLGAVVEEAMVDNYLNCCKEIWVIGGAEIYNQLVHLCSEIHISHINNNDVGDVKFEVPANYRGEVVHYYFEEDGRDPTETKSIKGSDAPSSEW